LVIDFEKEKMLEGLGGFRRSLDSVKGAKRGVEHVAKRGRRVGYVG